MLLALRMTPTYIKLNSEHQRLESGKNYPDQQIFHQAVAMNRQWSLLSSLRCLILALVTRQAKATIKLSFRTVPEQNSKGRVV